MTPVWLAKLKNLFGITKYQVKTVGVNVTANGALVVFNGLTVGKLYRYRLRVFAEQTVTTAGRRRARIRLINGGPAEYIHWGQTQADGVSFTDFELAINTNDFFVANATSVTFELADVSNMRILAGSRFILEEVANHVPTTDWT